MDRNILCESHKQNLSTSSNNSRSLAVPPPPQLPGQPPTMKLAKLLRYSIAFVGMSGSHLVLAWAPKRTASLERKGSSTLVTSNNKHGPLQKKKNRSQQSSCDARCDNNANDFDVQLLDDQRWDRRSILATFLSASLLFSGQPITAVAAAADNTKPQEFQNMGTQAPPPAGDSPFVTLPSGVKIKDFKIGKGDDVINPSTTSRVSIQCSGRLLNLNGVIFYNTKNNNPDGFGAIPLTFELGKGQVVPGLEEGVIGMKKGGIRRIIVPPELAYSKFPDLEPQPMNANDQRALDSVIKNPRRDATILFDVQVERFK